MPRLVTPARPATHVTYSLLPGEPQLPSTCVLGKCVMAQPGLRRSPSPAYTGTAPALARGRFVVPIHHCKDAALSSSRQRPTPTVGPVYVEGQPSRTAQRVKGAGQVAHGRKPFTPGLPLCALAAAPIHLLKRKPHLSGALPRVPRCGWMRGEALYPKQNAPALWALGTYIIPQVGVGCQGSTRTVCQSVPGGGALASS